MLIKIYCFWLCLCFSAISVAVPSNSSEINKSPLEGSVNQMNYFWLQIPQVFEQDITVNYATRDITAKAGSDYKSSSGIATIKAGQLSTLIGVEIIGDSLSELDESFELVLTHPIGLDFPDEIDEITAQHTILDDDTPLLNTLKPKLQYQFVTTDSMVLQGSSTDTKEQGYTCDAGLTINEAFYDLSLVSQFYSYDCYTDGDFNNKNYPVERGELKSTDNTSAFIAYKIYPARVQANYFVASKHILYFRFPRIDDYIVYRYEDNTFIKVTNINQASIVADSYTKITAINVSELDKAQIFFFVPKTQRVSHYWPIKQGIEAAKILDNEQLRITRYRVPVAGKLFDTSTGFDYGPGHRENIYVNSRNFFVLSTASQSTLAVVWQDQVSREIYLTQIDLLKQSHQTIMLSNQPSIFLASVTNDEDGNIYYLTIDDGDGTQTGEARTAILYKTDSAGQMIKQQLLDTSRNGLNIADYLRDSSSMQYSNGELGIIQARTMLTSADGLNHQGATAVVLDAQTLQVISNLGQTSGHSFESVLSVNNNGDFIGIDIGDNYPRGVNLHRFNAQEKASRVVFTYKTEHAQTPNHPANKTYPLYSAISTAQKSYYQWSNDNNNYTELGGLIEGEQGYSIIFSAESIAGKQTLDNSLTGDYLNAPRNIALVQVKKNFKQIYTKANVITNDLVLTQGVTETGGFYNFNGDWEEQRNTGVVWLTNYTTWDSNASRVKTLKLNNGNILILWEKWSALQYQSTYAMKVSETGEKLSSIIDLGSEVRLDRRDELVLLDNQLLIVTGNSNNKKLEVTLIQFSNDVL